MRFTGVHLRAPRPDASSHGLQRFAPGGSLGAALLTLAITLRGHPCAATCDVMLRWMGPPNIVGYHVYSGLLSDCQDSAATVCDCRDPAVDCYHPQNEPPGLPTGSTLNGVVYYFARDIAHGIPSGPVPNIPQGPVFVAVTAYNAAYVESDHSNKKVFDCSAAAAPQVNAGSDQSAPVGAALTLGSPPQAGLSYFWEQTAGPPATLSSRTSSRPGFSAGSAGTFTFTVTAYNAQGFAAQDSVTVTLTNSGGPTPSATSRASTATPTGPSGSSTPTPTHAPGGSTPIPTRTAIKIESDVLVRGNRRRPATDRSGCQVEWLVVSSGNAADRFGLPSQSQACTDGDPSCDFQPETPGLCEFHVRVCLNNADPNLPACTPGGIGTVDVRAPRPRAALGAAAYAMLAADADTLRNALIHLQDPSDRAAQSIYSPPLDPTEQGFCSATFAIQAMVSKRAGRPSVTLKTRSSDYATLRRRVAVSQLQLTCSPAAQ